MTTYESAFEAVTCESLEPFCTRFGLRKKHSGHLEVRFESDKVRLVVAQRHAWDQIYFAVGLISNGELYDLDSIAKWKAVEDLPMQVGDKRVLRRCLSKAATLLTESAPSLLAGQHSEFVQLAAFCSSRDEAYNKRIRMNPLLARAHEAWTEHRYGDVVEILSSATEDLGSVEKTRLRLAAKYLEQRGPTG